MKKLFLTLVASAVLGSSLFANQYIVMKKNKKDNIYAGIGSGIVISIYPGYNGTDPKKAIKILEKRVCKYPDVKALITEGKLKPVFIYHDKKADEYKVFIIDDCSN